MEPSGDTVPLLYPLHLREGRVRWPSSDGKKHNALVAAEATQRLLLPRGNYVLVKRFSSKEERRRVVAIVLAADALESEQVAIENHINVFHKHNAGLSTLSPGGQNVLIAALVQDFCPMFTPGGRVLYIGDADEKWAVFDKAGLSSLGVAVDSHGKMHASRMNSSRSSATIAHPARSVRRSDALDSSTSRQLSNACHRGKPRNSDLEVGHSDSFEAIVLATRSAAPSEEAAH